MRMSYRVTVFPALPRTCRCGKGRCSGRAAVMGPPNSSDDLVFSSFTKAVRAAEQMCNLKVMRTTVSAEFGPQPGKVLVDIWN